MIRVEKRKALVMFFWAALPGCITKSEGHGVAVEKEITIPVELMGELPKRENWATFGLEAKHRYLIPPGIIWVSSVKRPTSYLREGPGSKYPIADQVLTLGTQAILLERHQVWCKIYIPGRELVGWSHQDSLGLFIKNPKPILIKPEFFPTITTAESRVKVYSYPKGATGHVELSRGSVLRKISSDHRKNLVLMTIKKTDQTRPPVNSLAFPQIPNTQLSPLFLGQILWVDARDAW